MKITTLEKVFNRVDALSQNCSDKNVNVNDLSFDNLDSIKIAGEPHPLKRVYPGFPTSLTTENIRFLYY
jgi:hypothetical protein